MATGGSKRRIATDFALSEASVYRHFGDHLPARIMKAQEKMDVREALDIVGQLKFINAAALTVLRDARANGDQELVLKAIDRVQKQIELQARLIGELDDRPQINIWVSAEWLAIRSALLSALRDHPAARLEVAEALAGLEAVS